MPTDWRSTSEIDSDLAAIRAAQDQLRFAPASGERAIQRQTLSAREAELVAEREIAAEAESAARAAELDAKLAAAEGRLDDARREAFVHVQAIAIAQAKLNEAVAASQRAQAEIASRERKLEGVHREIEAVRFREGSTPEAIRAAAEAALEVLKFAPDHLKFTSSYNAQYKFNGFAIDGSTPRAAIDAIMRYQQIAPPDERRVFEKRLAAMADRSIVESRAEVAETLKTRQLEGEKSAVARRDAFMNGGDDRR